MIVAHAIPARAKMQFIISVELSARMKMPAVNAVVSMMTPAIMVFFLPILEAMIPTGRYEMMAAA